MRVTTPYEGQPFPGWDAHARIAAPLRLHRCTVREEWTDYNDHLSESFFLYIFGDNSDAFFRFFGVDEAYRAAGHSLFTVETHLRNLGQAVRGEALECGLWVLGVADRKLHIAHTLERVADGSTIATGEQLLVHVDLERGRATAFPDDIRSRLEQIVAVHALTERPDWVGRRITM